MDMTIRIEDAKATVTRRIVNGRITGLKRYEGHEVVVIVKTPDPM